MKRIFAVAMLIMAALALPYAAPASDVVLDNVLLVVTGNEVMAFSNPGNNWIKLKLQSRERVVETDAGGNVAVAITSERILGFSVLTNRWTQVRLHADERFLLIQARGNVATVETSLRVLGFSAINGSWIEAD